MRIFTLQFLALVFCALSLIPSGAHLAAMPNKMRLDQAGYFVAQGIYAGWSILGLLWFAAMIVLALLAFLSRTQRRPMAFSLAALACFAFTLIVFFTWTFPANQATANWTIAPETWEALRRRWEYSHAANAVIVFLAFVLTALAVLTWQRPASRGL